MSTSPDSDLPRVLSTGASLAAAQIPVPSSQSSHLALTMGKSANSTGAFSCFPGSCFGGPRAGGAAKSGGECGWCGIPHALWTGYEGDARLASRIPVTDQLTTAHLRTSIATARLVEPVSAKMFRSGADRAWSGAVLAVSLLMAAAVRAQPPRNNLSRVPPM